MMLGGAAPTLPMRGPFVLPCRWATKKAGGSTKNGRKSAGKRLGVKKGGGCVQRPSLPSCCGQPRTRARAVAARATDPRSCALAPPRLLTRDDRRSAPRGAQRTRPAGQHHRPAAWHLEVRGRERRARPRPHDLGARARPRPLRASAVGPEPPDGRAQARRRARRPARRGRPGLGEDPGGSGVEGREQGQVDAVRPHERDESPASVGASGAQSALIGVLLALVVIGRERRSVPLAACPLVQPAQFGGCAEHRRTATKLTRGHLRRSPPPFLCYESELRSEVEDSPRYETFFS